MSRTKRRTAARRGEGEKLRAEIVAVTSRLLEETGDASALSLRAVAREVGVAATSIYLHFDSLDSLIRAVKEEKYEELRQLLLAADTGTVDDPPERLRGATKAYVDFALERPGTYKVLFGTSLDLPPADSFIGERAFQVAVEVLIDTGKSRDDAHMAATQLWCTMHGMVTLRAIHPHFPWPERNDQLNDLVDLLLRS